MDLQTKIWLIFGLVSMGAGAIYSLLGLVIYKFYDMGRDWVVSVPTTPGGMADIKRKRLGPGQRFERPTRTGQPGEKDAVLGDPDAVYPSLRGPLRLIHKETGYSLIAPRPNELPIALRDIDVGPEELPHLQAGYAGWTPAQKAAAQEAANKAAEKRKSENTWRALTWLRMQVCTPLLYWKAIRTNDHQDWLDTQTGKPDWRVQIFPGVLLAFMALMAVFAYLIYKGGIPGLNG